MEEELDGIYFILSPSDLIHESLATDEDKRNSIAIGIKMDNRFANVVLHDIVNGDRIELGQDGERLVCSELLCYPELNEAQGDWKGTLNTNALRHNLNPNIHLQKHEYIPSLAELHLIVSNIQEINKALIEAGGEPMQDSWYWSSTQYGKFEAWCVNACDGTPCNWHRLYCNFVRPAICVIY